MRRAILSRFDGQLRALHEQHPTAEIHIVAHSEGSAIAFMALLRALSKSDGVLGDGWIDGVRSFSSFGSPIDKHLILWPHIWAEFETIKRADWRRRPQPIRWFNYYDYSDPIGFEHDTARARLRDWKCDAFRMSEHGFRRYLLPGQAHLDYFTDDLLFSHVIDNAIAPEFTGTRTEPICAWWHRCAPVSRVIPYVLCLAVFFAAVFIFHKSLIPSLDDAAFTEAAATTDVPPDARFTMNHGHLQPVSIPAASITTSNASGTVRTNRTRCIARGAGGCTLAEIRIETQGSLV